ncbi:hypothetical protein ACK3TF_000816 [Chlorella vulgaris]
MARRQADNNEFMAAARNAGQQLAAAFQPVVPFLMQAGASMAAYTVGLTGAQASAQRAAVCLRCSKTGSLHKALSCGLRHPQQCVGCRPRVSDDTHLILCGRNMQVAGMALRVSCATPVAGPIGGLLGVGVASAMAGQASIKCRQYLKNGTNPLLHPWKGVRTDDLIVDALLGVALFKASCSSIICSFPCLSARRSNLRHTGITVMGGRFRSVMPSDLVKVGAIARESLPAPSVEYATPASRIELRRLFSRDGCHHCGTRRGKLIGDHMPPNKHMQQTVGMARRSLLRVPFVKPLASALNIPITPPRQRFYPQCESCSQKQSSALRMVFHETLHRGGKSQAWHFAGPFLGLRHYTGVVGGTSSTATSNRGGTGYQRRS